MCLVSFAKNQGMDESELRQAFEIGRSLLFFRCFPLSLHPICSSLFDDLAPFASVCLLSRWTLRR
jgi:hypothetical protein